MRQDASILIGTGTFDDPERDPRDTGETTASILWFRCCYLGDNEHCDVTGETAEIFEIWPEHRTDYMDYTLACVAHVGQLMGSSDLTADPREFRVLLVQKPGESAIH